MRLLDFGRYFFYSRALYVDAGLHYEPLRRPGRLAHLDYPFHLGGKFGTVSISLGPVVMDHF